MNVSSSRNRKSYAHKFRDFVRNASEKNQQKKRDYIESFGLQNYDVERYGQEIDVTFFVTNTGHAVIA